MAQCLFNNNVAVEDVFANNMTTIDTVTITGTVTLILIVFPRFQWL